MKTLSQKYAEQIICSKVDKIGTESKFSHEKVIKINDENYQFNLGNSAWLIEISKDNLIDSYGNRWQFNNLSGDEFFALVDYIKGLKK